MLLSNIPQKEFTRFLNSGALLRWNQSYYLILGPSPADSADGFKIYAPNFFLDVGTKFQKGVQSYQISEFEFAEKLREFLEHEKPSQAFEWRDPDFKDYKIAFDKIKTEISAGRLQKAVPVLFAKSNAKFGPERRARALLKLTESPSRLYVYGMWNEQEGILGATPETLATFFSGEIRGMALAGTQLKGTGECRLLSDSKELHEHKITSDDIKKILGEFGEVTAQGPHVLELPSLWHLKTEMRVGTKYKIDLMNLIEKLHPTPALGVSPRSFDFRWMKDLPEASMRNKFGAPFALQFPNGDFISVVAIRNIQWSENEILLGAGGGLVQESEIEKEWLELEGKRNSVKALMGL